MFARRPAGPAVPFRNRRHAGKLLASYLQNYADRADVLVLGLARGGVPVAFEVARALHVPLDVFLVRKLGVPGQRELALGAIASGGVRVLNRQVIAALDIGPEEIEAVAREELRELERRERLYHNGRPAPNVRGKTVLVVDDGLATGATMRAAITALRQLRAGTIVVAVPVGARATCEELRAEADDVICISEPEEFYAVGLWYEDFSQVTDEEIRELLEQSVQETGSTARSSAHP
jgi:putative phosphoribosyl transferase